MPILCFPVCEEIPCVRGISGKALQQARLRLAKHNVNFGLALSTLAEHTSALVPLVGCAPSESSRAQWGAPADELAAMIDTGALEGRGAGGSDVLVTTPIASHWIPLCRFLFRHPVILFIRRHPGSSVVMVPFPPAFHPVAFRYPRPRSCI